MLASVVTHSSQSKVAPAALLELRTAYDLFQQASAYGGRAVKFFVRHFPPVPWKVGCSYLMTATVADHPTPPAESSSGLRGHQQWYSSEYPQ